MKAWLKNIIDGPSTTFVAFVTGGITAALASGYELPANLTLALMIISAGFLAAAGPNK